MRRALFMSSLAVAVLFGSQTATASLRPVSEKPFTPQPIEQLPLLQVERTLTLKRGDTLAGTLKTLGFSKQQIQALTRSNAAAAKPVAAKTTLHLSYEESAPYQVQNATLTYRPEPTQELSLALNGLVAQAKAAAKPVRDVQAVAVGTIHDSLYEDATNAGLPPALVNSFMNLFAWDLDYTRDIHPGDTFKVMFEETQNDKGERVKTGRILAAEFKVGNETRHAYYFAGEYLNEKGDSKRKLLLRTPLEFTRISSNFDLARKHPVLGFTRAHKGTDFAAPSGTPIKASGDGVVVFEGRHGGHGNYLQIKHNATFTTAYAHLSAYARGLKVGSRVKQGQIVAYVGSTGVSTGPHLHYEVIRNGQFVDAMRTDLPTGSPLSRNQLAQFKALVNNAQTAWNKALTTRQVATR